MQVAGVQQYPVPNFMLLVPVTAVKVPLLVLLHLQQVSLGHLKQVLDMQNKVSCPSMVTTTSSGKCASSPMVSSVRTYPVLSVMAELMASSTYANSSHHYFSDKCLLANRHLRPTRWCSAFSQFNHQSMGDRLMKTLPCIPAAPEITPEICCEAWVLIMQHLTW